MLTMSRNLPCRRHFAFLPPPSFPFTPTSISAPALVLCSASPPRRQRAARKPTGYWNNPDNLRRELIEHYNATTPSRPINSMPTARELRATGRRDLDNAISNLGGYRTVGQQLGFISTSSRRPKGFWEDFTNVRTELLAFVATQPDPTIMPTQRVLREAGRADLFEALARHGGTVTVADRIGLSRSVALARGFWKEWSSVKIALREFMTSRPDDDIHRHRMPSQRELRAAGLGGLADAISRHHGGFKAAAERLGLSGNKHDDFYWEKFPNVARETYNVAIQIATPATMPNSAVLRKIGRSDLAAAIGQHGGMALVAKRLGLQYRVRAREAFKEWTTFQRSLLAFMERHGTPTALPSSRTLANFGRDDLYAAMLHHGGAREVSDRMGLKRAYWLEFYDVGRDVLEFCSVHGEEDVMPTERDFADVGRTALDVAVAKFGYSQVAQRLGLKEPRQGTKMAFDALLTQSMMLTDEDEDEDFFNEPLQGTDLHLPDDSITSR